MNTPIKLFLRIAAPSFLLVLLTGLLRMFVNYQTSSLVGFILYFAWTVYATRKFSDRISAPMILAALLFGICLMQIPIRIDSFRGTLISLPDFLVHLMGIFAGFAFMKTKPAVGYSVALTSLALTFYIFFSGYGLWIHKDNFGTFRGEVAESCPDFLLLTQEGDTITAENFRGKTVVLDFWNTGCGVCFKKFPAFQEKYDRYKNSADVEFYAVNYPIGRESRQQAVNAVRMRSYTFPLLFLPTRALSEPFKVQSFPTTLVLKAGKIVYRGDIEGVDRVLSKAAGKE